jgi:hypothetical protein
MKKTRLLFYIFSLFFNQLNTIINCINLIQKFLLLFILFILLCICNLPYYTDGCKLLNEYDFRDFKKLQILQIDGEYYRKNKYILDHLELSVINWLIWIIIFYFTKSAILLQTIKTIKCWRNIEDTTLLSPILFLGIDEFV